MALVGRDVTMVGGLAKVTGAVNYAPVLQFPRMLYAKALRSPYPHANILRIDTAKAEKLPGVVAVITQDDLHGLNPYFGPVVDDQPVVATERVRHVGEVVALVAGESREIAEEAVGLIEIDYEELPAVFDILEAIKPDARCSMRNEKKLPPMCIERSLTFRSAGMYAAFIMWRTATFKRAFWKRMK